MFKINTMNFHISAKDFLVGKNDDRKTIYYPTNLYPFVFVRNQEFKSHMTKNPFCDFLYETYILFYSTDKVLPYYQKVSELYRQKGTIQENEEKVDKAFANNLMAITLLHKPLSEKELETLISYEGKVYQLTFDLRKKNGIK